MQDARRVQVRAGRAAGGRRGVGHGPAACRLEARAPRRQLRVPVPSAPPLTWWYVFRSSMAALRSPMVLLRPSSHTLSAATPGRVQNSAMAALTDTT